MHTLIEQAWLEKISRQVSSVAAAEGIDAELLCRRMAEGSAVIMQRGERYTGIGKLMGTRIFHKSPEGKPLSPHFKL